MIKYQLNHNWVMAIVVVVMFGANTFMMDITPISKGCGQDGRSYCNLAKSFRMFYGGNQKVYSFSKSSSDYLLHRVLPSALVHIPLVLTGAPINTPEKPVHWEVDDIAVIFWFKILNILAMGIAALFWGLIAHQLGLGVWGKWIGFFSFFVNFQHLKMAGFMPVTTDLVAFSLSMALLYYFLINCSRGMFVVLLLGAFTWPSYLIFMAPLFLFSHVKSDSNNPDSIKFFSDEFGTYFGIATGGAVIIFSSYLALYEGYFHIDARFLVLPVIFLSIAIIGLFVGVAMRFLISNFSFRLRMVTGKGFLEKAVVLLIIFIFVEGLVNYYEVQNDDYTPPNTSLWIIKAAMVQPILQPFSFGLGHIVSFGPILIITFCFWEQITKSLQKYGPGLTLFLVAGILISLVAPSRGVTIFMPCFIAFTIKAMEKVHWKFNAKIVFFILCFLYSKVWVIWNIRGEITSHEVALSFPWQYLLGNWGNWMSGEMYIVNLAVVLLTLLVFHIEFEIMKLRKKY